MAVVGDFLGVEPLLLAALRDPAIEDVRGVYSVGSATLDDAFAGKQAPSLYVAYSGYSVLESLSHGPFAQIEQEWLVLVQTLNVTDVSGGAAARAQAGPICSAVLSRVHGMRLGDGYTRLTIATPPRELYRLGRFLIPLAFRTRVQVDPDYE